MKNRLIPALCVAAIVMIAVTLQAQDKQVTTGKKVTTVQTSAGAQYTCPMHPDVTSDNAGKCSKCGMDLTKKSAGTAKAAKMGSKKSMKKGCCKESCSEQCEEK